MVLTKEYRICMPLTTKEYRIGQLYMIARHSHEQSDNHEGIEVVESVACKHPEHGNGQCTEKRIHLFRSACMGLVFVFVCCIAANFPLGFSLSFQKYFMSQKRHGIIIHLLSQCSFIPKFHISIRTRYEDNNGSTENCLGLSPIELTNREVDFVDIAYDELSAKHYKEEEDPKYLQSKRTGRGPLIEGWRENTQPIMCSYKLVHASFEVCGRQTRVETYIHSCIRDILLLGHRQAFAWIDEWYDMTLKDVREYEKKMQAETDEKVGLRNQNNEKPITSMTPTSSVPSSPIQFG